MAPMVSVDRRRHTQIGMTAQIAAIARAGAHASGDELGGFVPAPLRSHAHPECHHQRAGDHMEEQLLVVPLRAVCWPAKLGNCGGVEEFSVVVADTIHLRADLFLVTRVHARPWVRPSTSAYRHERIASERASASVLAFGSSTPGDQPGVGRSLARGSTHRAAGSCSRASTSDASRPICGLDD